MKCECGDYTSTELPCRHIFVVREHFKLPLFDITLCPRRWCMKYNIEIQPVLQSFTVTEAPKLPEYTTYEIPAKSNKSFPTWLKMMQEVAGNLAHCGSLVTKERYEKRLEVLQKIEQAWRRNIEVDVVLNEDVPFLSSLTISDEPASLERKEEASTEKEKNDSIVLPTPLISGRPSGITKSTIKKKEIKKELIKNISPVFIYLKPSNLATLNAKEIILLSF